MATAPVAAATRATAPTAAAAATTTITPTKVSENVMLNHFFESIQLEDCDDENTMIHVSNSENIVFSWRKTDAGVISSW